MLPSVLIYQDTNIWNRLCRQEEDPIGILRALSAKGATLLLSPHEARDAQFDCLTFYRADFTPTADSMRISSSIGLP